MQAFVGNFLASTSATPQSITGVGFTPQALLFWSGAGLATSSGLFNVGSLGMAFAVASATSAQFTVGEGDQHNQPTPVAWSACSTNAVRFVAGGVANGGESSAVISALTSDGFTLSYTSFASAPRTVFFLALGGGIRANAHTWTLATSSGTKQVTGVGFRPSVVLLFAPSEGITTFASSSAGSRLRLGVFNEDGSQWALCFSAETFSSASNSNTERVMVSDASLIASAAGAQKYRATFLSMDTDGYSLNFTQAAGTAGLVAALAIGNVSARVGVTAKPTGVAPAAHTISGLNIRAKAIVLASDQNTATTAITDNGEIGFGAATTAAVGSVAKIDRDNLALTVAERTADATRCFIKVDNGTPTIDAEATLTSLGEGSAVLSWNANDAVATQLGYLVFGDPPARIYPMYGTPAPKRYQRRTREPRDIRRRR